MYSFREAYESGGFLQQDLVDCSELDSLAGKYGIASLGTDREKLLEELDEVGAFCPIAFAPSGYQLTRYHALSGQPELVFRDEAGFSPWKTYTWDDDVHERVTALYSPWQLLYLDEARERRTMPVPVNELRNPSRAASVPERWGRIAEAYFKRWSSIDSRWRPLVLLMVRLQNRYWPHVGPWTWPIDPKTHDHVNPFPRERRLFVARAALDQLELTAEDVEGYYQSLSFEIQRRDPIGHWWILRRSATEFERGRFQREAREVEKFWEAAAILRMFYRALTRRVLADVDAVGHDHHFTEAALGHPARLYYDRGDLIRFLKAHHLYPHQLHLFVEGHSEAVIFPALIAAIHGSVEAQGVRLTNLRGIDNLHERYRELFEGFASYARHAFLIADKEGLIARYVKGLVEDKLIDPEAVFLWDDERGNFQLEETNFSDAELVRAARAAAIGAGGRLVSLSGKMVRRSFEERRERLRAAGPKTFTDELLRLASDPDRGSVPLGKVQLAEKLRDLLLSELAEAQSWDALLRRRQVYRALTRLLEFLRAPT